jgi:hypothetical protein
MAEEGLGNIMEGVSFLKYTIGLHGIITIILS